MTDAQIKARFKADFLRVNGLEAVVHGRQDDQGTPIITLDIPKALWRGSARQIVPTHVMVASGNTAWWHVPFDYYNNAGVYPRTETDYIVDEYGIIWTIKEIKFQTWRTRYRFTCVQGN